MARLRIPAVLTVAVLGCNGSTPVVDARLADGAPADGYYIPFGDGNCGAVCFGDGTDAGVCPDPIVCVADDRTCPAGCMCTRYCFPRTPEGRMNCPTEDGLDCTGPNFECPEGCEPVA
jgi:hypothetical protein